MFGSPRGSTQGRSLVRSLRQYAQRFTPLRRQLRGSGLSLLLLLTVLLGPGGVLTNLSVLPMQAPSFAAGKSGPPNRFDPRQGANSVVRPPARGHSDPNWKTPHHSSSSIRSRCQCNRATYP
jgi:hypothetical protein